MLIKRKPRDWGPDARSTSSRWRVEHAHCFPALSLMASFSQCELGHGGMAGVFSPQKSA